MNALTGMEYGDYKLMRLRYEYFEFQKPLKASSDSSIKVAIPSTSQAGRNIKYG